MKYWRGKWSPVRWLGAVLVPFVIGGHSMMTALTVATAIPALVLVGVVAMVASGAAFGRSPARRRACLQTLETLLQLAPWTGKR